MHCPFPEGKEHNSEKFIQVFPFDKKSAVDEAKQRLQANVYWIAMGDVLRSVSQTALERDVVFFEQVAVVFEDAIRIAKVEPVRKSDLLKLRRTHASQFEAFESNISATQPPLCVLKYVDTGVQGSYEDHGICLLRELPRRGARHVVDQHGVSHLVMHWTSEKARSTIALLVKASAALQSQPEPTFKPTGPRTNGKPEGVTGPNTVPLAELSDYHQNLFLRLVSAQQNVAARFQEEVETLLYERPKDAPPTPLGVVDTDNPSNDVELRIHPRAIELAFEQERLPPVTGMCYNCGQLLPREHSMNQVPRNPWKMDHFSDEVLTTAQESPAVQRIPEAIIRDVTHPAIFQKEDDGQIRMILDPRPEDFIQVSQTGRPRCCKYCKKATGRAKNFFHEVWQADFCAENNYELPHCWKSLLRDYVHQRMLSLLRLDSLTVEHGKNTKYRKDQGLSHPAYKNHLGVDGLYSLWAEAPRQRFQRGYSPLPPETYHKAIDELRKKGNPEMEKFLTLCEKFWTFAQNNPANRTLPKENSIVTTHEVEQPNKPLPACLEAVARPVKVSTQPRRTRATCRICRSQIAEGDLRVAKRLHLSDDPLPTNRKVEPGSKQDVFVNAYMHWRCYWECHSVDVLKDGQRSPELCLAKYILNFEKLPAHKQQEIAKAWVNTASEICEQNRQSVEGTRTKDKKGPSLHDGCPRRGEASVRDVREQMNSTGKSIEHNTPSLGNDIVLPFVENTGGPKETQVFEQDASVPEASSLLGATFPTGVLRHPTRTYDDETEAPIANPLQDTFEIKVQKESDANRLQFAAGGLRPVEPTSVNFDERGYGRIRGVGWPRTHTRGPAQPAHSYVSEWKDTEAKLWAFNRELIRDDKRTDLALFPLLHPYGIGAHDPRAENRIPDTWYNRIRSVHYCDFWRTNLDWILYRHDMFLKNKIFVLQYKCHHEQECHPQNFGRI